MCAKFCGGWDEGIIRVVEVLIATGWVRHSLQHAEKQWVGGAAHKFADAPDAVVRSAHDKDAARRVHGLLLFLPIAVLS